MADRPPTYEELYPDGQDGTAVGGNVVPISVATGTGRARKSPTPEGVRIATRDLPQKATPGGSRSRLLPPPTEPMAVALG